MTIREIMDREIRTSKEDCETSTFIEWLESLKIELCQAQNDELNKLHRERIESEDYHSKRVIEWIKSGGRNAVTSFTSGPQRQIAYEVEKLTAKLDLLRRYHGGDGTITREQVIEALGKEEK